MSVFLIQHERSRGQLLLFYLMLKGYVKIGISRDYPLQRNTNKMFLFIMALRQKELGDWRQLCCEEKKALYRASFCQTVVEFQYPTGQWKAILGGILFISSFAFWLMMFTFYYVKDPLPPSFSEQSQKAQLRRMLELRVNPIDGLSSHWDYDNDRWK